MKDEFTERLPLLAFDREMDLGELLQGIDTQKLYTTLASLLGCELQIINADKQHVLGD